MGVGIPVDLRGFVKDLIAQGRCSSETQVVDEAIRLFQEVERRRAQLRRDIQAGLDSPTIPGELVFQELDRLVETLQHRANVPA